MNIYYNPEKFGLKIVYEVETGGSYEFCTTVIFLDEETNKLYYSQDSGCSCPTPFDGDCKEELDPLNVETFNQFANQLKEFHYDYSDDYSDMEYAQDLKKIKKLIKKHG